MRLFLVIPVLHYCIFTSLFYGYIFQVDQLSNRVGNYFAAQGIKHGDAIGIFMENSVEYICLWLGLCKVSIALDLSIDLVFDSFDTCHLEPCLMSNY